MSEVQWLLFDGFRQQGPCTTDAVLEIGQRGQLLESASIREYPNGSWQPVSESPFRGLVKHRINGWRIALAVVLILILAALVLR